MSSLRHRVAVLAVAALVLSGCAESSDVRPVEFPNDGIQLSGRVGGANLAVSDGDPDFLVTDCDTEDGLDRDWCLVARSIDGARVEFVFENPGVHVAGAELDVDTDACGHCDDVTTAAIVDLIVAGTPYRAVNGTIHVDQVGPRYAMRFSLRFADGGSINGEFNVRPLGALVPATTPSDS